MKYIYTLVFVCCASALLAQQTYAWIGLESSGGNGIRQYEMYEVDPVTGDHALLFELSFEDFDFELPKAVNKFLVFSFFLEPGNPDIFYFLENTGQVFRYDRRLNELTKFVDIVPNSDDFSDMYSLRPFTSFAISRDSVLIGGSIFGVLNLNDKTFETLWRYPNAQVTSDPVWRKKTQKHIFVHNDSLYCVSRNLQLTYIPSLDPEQYLAIANLPPFTFGSPIIEYRYDCGPPSWLFFDYSPSANSADTLIEVKKMNLKTGALTPVSSYTKFRLDSYQEILDMVHIPPRSYEECQRLIDLDGDDSTAPDIDFALDSICAFGLLPMSDSDIDIHHVGRFDSLTIALDADLGTLDIASGNYSIDYHASGATLRSNGSTTDLDLEAGIAGSAVVLHPDIDQDIDIAYTLWVSGEPGQIARARYSLSESLPDAGRDTTVLVCTDESSIELGSLISATSDSNGIFLDDADLEVGPSVEVGALSPVLRYVVQHGPCADTAFLRFDFSAPPMLAPIADIVLCDQDSLLIALPRAYPVKWADGDTSHMRWINRAGTYTYQMGELANCTAQDTFAVAYLDTVKETVADTSICWGDTLWLAGEPFWQDTLIRSVVSNVRGCDSLVTLTSLSLRPAIAYDLGYSGSLCDDGTVSLEVSPEPSVLSWDIANPDLVDGPGTYTATITSEDGCTQLDSVEVFPVVNPAVSGQLSYAFWSADTTFQPLLDISGGVSYDWSPSLGLSCDNCPDPIIVAETDLRYTLTVYSADGCTESVEVVIDKRELEKVEPQWPNIFNPNSDMSDNRYFYLKAKGAQEYRMSIYDRWGSEVWASAAARANVAEQGWDGVIAGRLAEQGVYVYVAEIIWLDGSTSMAKGDVVLFR